PDSINLQIIDLAIMFTNYLSYVDKTLAHSFTTNTILTSNIPFSHRQRVMLAIVMSCIYSFKLDNHLISLSKKTLSMKDYSNSYITGNILRLAKISNDPEFYTQNFNLVFSPENKIKLVTSIILPQAVLLRVHRILDNIQKIH